MQDFRRLRAWQANRELTVLVYRVTRDFPREERYGLAAQMRSAAVSIGANIAEGCGRGSRADMQRFIQMAVGSSVELLHHLITSLDLGYLARSQFDEVEGRNEAVRKMLSRLIGKLRDAEQ